MTPEAEEIYARLKIRPRKVRTGAPPVEEAKPATKATTKPTAKPES